MLKVWGRRSSFNVQKVLWFLGELGLVYEHIPAGGSFGGLDELAFRAMNPQGRVPVVEDGEVAIWESHTICAIWPPATAGEVSGTTIRQKGRAWKAGWTGRRPHCNPMS